MPDWVKLTTKTLGSDLAAGETVVAGVFVNAGGFGSRLMGKELGGIAGIAIARKGQKDREETVGESLGGKKDGIAATLPTPPKILAVTNERLLFFGRSSMSGKPKALEHSMPRTEIVSVEIDPKTAADGLVIRFSDDSFVYYDAPKMGNDANPFVEAFAD